MIKYLTISDIHLGLKRNTTEEILNNLTSYFDNFSENSKFKNLDILFIAGDLFDTSLDYFDPDILKINLWMSRLMTFCAQYKIILRILEGTPSHDWKQSRNFKPIADSFKDRLNYRYIEDIEIEYLNNLQLYILYMPDEARASATLSIKRVKELLIENNINQVDIAIMHGAFTYQIPGVVNESFHNENDYLDIVKYFINIGHVHSFSVNQRIIAQGSFDRLSHNEEEPKGGVVCYLSDQPSYEFIENKKAKIFKTIYLRSDDVYKNLDYIDNQISRYPQGSYIRIKAKKDNQIFKSFDSLKSKYILYYLSKTTIEDESEEKQIQDQELTQYNIISITQENIVSLLKSEVISENSLSVNQLNKLDKILLDHL